MARILKKDIEKKFAHLIVLMNLPKGKIWTRDEATGTMKARVGAVLLDYAPMYGGYQMRQITNEGGGETIFPPSGMWSNRLPTREFAAFLDGMIAVLEMATIPGQTLAYVKG
jgi:hypothetical protein